MIIEEKVASQRILILVFLAYQSRKLIFKGRLIYLWQSDTLYHDCSCLAFLTYFQNPPPHNHKSQTTFSPSHLLFLFFSVSSSITSLSVPPLATPKHLITKMITFWSYWENLIMILIWSWSLFGDWAGVFCHIIIR